MTTPQPPAGDGQPCRCGAGPGSCPMQGHRRKAVDGPAQALHADVDEAARCLELFERAVSVTGTAAATIQQIGPYHRVSFTGEAFAVAEGATTLRLEREAVTSLVRVKPMPGSGARPHPPGLHLLDATGAVVHHCHPLTAFDQLLLDGLARSGTEDDCEGDGGHSIERAATPLTSRGDRAQATLPWDEGDQLAQIDAILHDGGVRRRQLFNELYPYPHAHADPTVLAAVLTHLADLGCPLTLGVFSDGAFQAAGGPIRTVREHHHRLHLAMPSASIELDLSHIRECFLVRSHGPLGPTWGIELYDGVGCVGLLTQVGIVEPVAHEQWERVVGSVL